MLATKLNNQVKIRQQKNVEEPNFVCKMDDVRQRKFIIFPVVESKVGASGRVYKLRDGFWYLQQDLVSEAMGKNIIRDSIQREIGRNNEKINGLAIQNQELLKFMRELK